MANLLPVLQVSLSTNALNVIPDDSSLSTAPRAQVDYLSHDWEEEDVWRSWRNMTRQKNAITNGARLENASWRTWWKQRNKLGTISPETLNWLKDSDVTWLYGPLHTAEEWKPPPSHRPHKSTTVTPARPNSPSGHRSRRLPQPAAYKPILKHRSISELLTSELPPTSPILSPLEFWEDSEPDATTGDADAHLDIRVKRPPLFHTKSDTQLTRWGSSRAFRKTSPLRLDPGSESGEQSSPRSSSQLLSAGGPVRASLSQDSNSSGKSAASGSEHSRGRHRKKHISFNTFVEQYIAIDKPKKNASGYFGAIPATFLGGRTAWVDHAGYDEEREDSEEDMNTQLYIRDSDWKLSPESYGVGVVRGGDDSPEEDEEDEDEDAPIEIRSSSSRSSSTLRPDRKLLPRSQSKVSNSSSSSASTTRSTTSSRSDASHSTADDTSSPSGSLSPTRRISSSSSVVPKASSSALGPPHLYRRSSTTTSISNYRPSFNRLPRPPPLRSPFESNSRSQHVTIAPIAPTLLKTTPAASWTENLGDDGTGSGDDIFASWPWGIGGKVGVSDFASSRKEDVDRDRDRSSSGLQRRRSWTGSETYGFALGAFGTGDPPGIGFGATISGALDSNDDGHVSDGTPVELVYAPPFDFYADEDLVEDDDPSVPEEEPGSMGEEGTEIEQVEDVEEQGNYYNVPRHPIPSVVSSSSHIAPTTNNRLPTVVVDTFATPLSFAARGRQSLKAEVIVDDDEEDPDDYLPDMEDYYPWRGGRGYEYSTGGTNATRSRTSTPNSSSRPSYAADAKQRAREMERKTVRNGEGRPSRNRSRSESRTPSPALMTSPASAEPSPTDGRPRSYSGSFPLKNSVLPTASSTRKTSSYSDLLSPPRGRQHDGPSSRSANVTSSPQEERRGRSSLRTTPSSSWDRDRGSSGSLGSSTSPLGSLSPDGGAGARTSSGVGVGFGVVLGGGKVEKEKERENRNRRGREKTSSKMSAATSSDAPVTSPVGKKPDTSIFSVASSSSSSTSSTVMPIHAGTSGKEEETGLMHAEGLLPKESIPATPTNSPALEAQASWDSTPVNGAMVASTSEKPTPRLSPIHTRNVPAPTCSPPNSPSTPSPQRSSSKYRPPLALRPSPPMPVRPRTSLAAAVSPIGIANHGAVASGVTNSGAQSEHTIVGKAVDMVSSAGMYLALWSRERVTSLSPGSPT